MSGWVITPPTFPKQVGCRIQTWIQTWSFEGFLQCSTHACSSWATHAVPGRNNNRKWVWRHKIQKYKDWPLQHPMLRNIPQTFEKCHHNLTPTLLLAVETAYRDSCSSFTWDFQIFWRHCAADQTWPRLPPAGCGHPDHKKNNEGVGRCVSPVCSLHAWTIRAQKWMQLLWLRSMGKREEIGYLCSPTRHIMFQLTPLPLSRFFPSLNLFFDTQRRITTGARTVQDTGGRWLT